MEFNYKQFKYKTFQFLSIVEILHPNTRLECVWIEYFNEANIFLKNLDFFVIKCFVWIEKLKSISNASIFFEGFQLAKLVEIQIPSK